MKKIISLVAAILFTFGVMGCISMAPVEKRTQEMIVELPKTTKKANYIKSLEWFTLTFKSGKDVIDFKDEESGKIVGKGYINFGEFTGSKIYVFMTVEVKDNKARITCVAQNLTFPENTRDIDANLELPEVLVKTKALMNEYKAFMQKANTKKDW
jgi:hypothetical protein